MNILKLPVELIKKVTTMQVPKNMLGNSKFLSIPNDSFTSSKSVMSIPQAKHLCIKALKSKAPREEVYVINSATNQLIQHKVGTTTHCPIDISVINLTRGLLSLIHGHPCLICENGKYYTAPLSLDDFRILNSSKLHEIIAIDEFGRESKLVKGSNYKALSSKEMQQLEQEIFKTLIKTMPQQETIELLSKTDDDTIVNYAIKRAEQQQTTRVGMQALDCFWKKYVPKYNLSYSSNLIYDE